MKRFVKKNLWLLVICGWLVAVVLSLVFLHSTVKWIVALIVSLIAVFMLAGYFLNSYCLKVFKAMAPTSYFQDLRFRNMNAVAVGSTAAWKYLNIDTDKCYNAIGYRRSNFMCFNMLKTYFSHVKNGGEVYYILDPVESENIGNYISPCDFLHIHRLVFLYLDISSSEKRRAYPAIYDFSFSVRCVVSYFMKKHGMLLQTWKRCDNSIPIITESLRKEIDEVCDFCSDRELICKIVIINRSLKSDAEVIESIRNSTGWKNDVLLTVVSDRDGLNNAVCV